MSQLTLKAMFNRIEYTSYKRLRARLLDKWQRQPLNAQELRADVQRLLDCYTAHTGVTRMVVRGEAPAETLLAVIWNLTPPVAERRETATGKSVYVVRHTSRVALAQVAARA